MQERFDRIEEKLDRIEGKLDNHVERIARAEEGLNSMRGHIKLIASALLAVFSAAIAALFNGFPGGK